MGDSSKDTEDSDKEKGIQENIQKKILWCKTKLWPWYKSKW